MPGLSLVTSVATALVVFYLYLAVRPQNVKRPLVYLIGVAGLLLVLLAQFFGLSETSRALAVVMMVFEIIGVIAAFAGAVAACYTGKLPGLDDALGPKGPSA